MTRPLRTGPGGLPRIVSIVRSRLSERAFWLIQAMVIAVSLLHVVLEAGWISDLGSGAVEGIHHLPVVLYLIPVAYASLAYGLEGGVLTSLWAGALASVNVLLFGVDDYEWVVDFGFVSLVVAVGIITALPVESERRQRRRAEGAAERFEVLNRLAAMSLSARGPGEAVAGVLSRVVEIADLEDASLTLWRSDDPHPIVRVNHRSPPVLQDASAPGAPDPGDAVVAVVEARDLRGRLVALPRHPETDADLTSFLAAVGNQLAAAVENALLLEQEQEAWSRYVRLVTEAQEEERRRLARELHDGPAQRLSMLVRSLDGSHALHDDAAAILADLRRVARDQRPTLLDDLGVAAALEWLVDDSNRSDGAAIELRTEGETARLAPESEIVLYRVAQEAIRNAQLHAKASRIDVSIEFSTSHVRLSVSDDGVGFDLPQNPGGYLERGKLGIMGMRERVQLVGGSLSIRSQSGRGTVVKATVPREPKKSDRDS